MSRKEISAKVRSIIADVLLIDPSQVKESTSIQASLGMDSLDYFEIVLELEMQFSIAIEDDEAEAATTVKDVVDLVVRKLKEKKVL